MCRGVVNFQSFLETMYVIKYIFHEQWFFIPFAPTGRLKNSQHEIFISNDFWLAFLVGHCQHMLNFILVDDQNITGRAITAMFVDCCRIMRLNVDKEGYFANQHFAFTVRAGGKPHVCVRVQDESVHWRQLANSCKFRLLSHIIRAYTVHKVYHQSKCCNERIPTLRMANPWMTANRRRANGGERAFQSH